MTVSKLVFTYTVKVGILAQMDNGGLAPIDDGEAEHYCLVYTTKATKNLGVENVVDYTCSCKAYEFGGRTSFVCGQNSSTA